MALRISGIRTALGAIFALLPLTSAAPPFGLQIFQCTQPGVIAPGFDDGPWIYSEDILNKYAVSVRADLGLRCC